MKQQMMITMLGAATLLGACAEPSPYYAPVGSELAVNPELGLEVYLEAGYVLPARYDVVVTDPDTGMGLNGALVDFTSLGAGILVPAESIEVVSNQNEASSWCEPYLEGESANEALYNECMNDLYVQFTGFDTPIFPTYAQVATDERGVATIYLLAFCGPFNNGQFDCLKSADYVEDVQALFNVSIGVDSVSLDVILLGAGEEEEE